MALTFQKPQQMFPDIHICDLLTALTACLQHPRASFIHYCSQQSYNVDDDLCVM